ncbi:MAG TPA: FGGY family carbohydrate kinase [Actinotalea sp.]
MLGLDIGTTNTKAVLARIVPSGSATRAERARPDLDLGDSCGEQIIELARAAAPTPATAADLVDTALRVVRTVVERAGVAPDAVGIASMAETGVPLDAAGRPLTDLLRWDGHRAADEALALSNVHGRLELFRATGVRSSAKVPLATWAWLRAHEPEIHTRMAAWAGVADLVALAMTGDLVTDHTLAGRTMGYLLPAGGAALATAFDADLVATVGLRPQQLPRVVPPDEAAGQVGGRTCTQTQSQTRGDAPRSAAGLGDYWSTARSAFVAAGLRRGTPVVVAGHDHAVGSWAAGVRTDGDRADSLGTAEAVMTVLPDQPGTLPYVSDRVSVRERGAPGELGAPDTPREPVERPTRDAVIAAGMSWVRTVSGDHSALLAGSSSAGAMVGWLMRALAAEATDAVTSTSGFVASADGLLSRDELFAAVAADVVSSPDPSGVLVLPYLSGRQSPAPDPDVRVVVEPAAGGLSLARGVLEGLCLQARWMFDAQLTLVGGEPGPVAVLGGAAVANPAWTEVKARVMPAPLRWVAVDEPVAMGAALLAAVRLGLLGDDVRTLLSAGTGQPGAAPSLPVADAPPGAATPGATRSGAATPRGPRDPHLYDAMYERFVALAVGAGR